jgi:outer membrane protein OmpA-like peptidoglycan-associated protein
MTRIPSVLVLAVALAAMAALPADAQRFPGFGSIEGRIGITSPENAGTGLFAAADLGLGYVGFPSLRTIAGLHYWTADADRAGVTGDFTAIGGQAGLRLEVMPTSVLAPYVYGTVIGQNVDASLSNADTQGLLEGFNVGASVGVGLSYSLDQVQRTRVTVEYKQTFINNFDSWGVTVGFRLVPRGNRAYLPVARFRDPVWGTEAERVRLERERLEVERRRAEQERLAQMTDTERLRAQEAERARLERERLEAERRAEQERMARMTDEERRRAQERADVARRQAEQEAAARVAAEADAARARQEAEAARAEADAARRQAAEAEAQLFQRLQELDQLIANVTGVRETERGLSVVLGQGLFAVGQSSLSPRARDEVGRIAAVLAQFPDRRIAVEGHTDATGSAASNQRLSEQRAASVRAALIANGIDPNRVEMVGHGQDLPIADNATVAGRAENRRVEIVILGARRPAS